MTARDDDDDDDGLGWLDGLAQRAAEAPLPAMDEHDASRRVARAMTEAAARSVAASKRRTRWAVGVAAVSLLALGGGALARMVDGGEGRAAPLVMSLPTGDRVTATEGARFRMLEIDARARGVVLDEGAVLFDVRALRDDQRFEVTSGRTTVRVRGTVFSVRRAGDDVDVQVYEGRVEVLEGSRRWDLRAGRRLSRGREESLDASAPLAREGMAAASARARGRSTSSGEDPVASTPLARRDEAAPRAPDDGAATSTVATGGSNEHAVSDDRAAGVAGRAERGLDPRARGASSRGQTSTTVVDVTSSESIAQARRWLADGEPDRALTAARLRAGGAWRMLEADALRALGRHEDAADAYDRAARELGGSARAQAGYLAATLRRDRSNDAPGALRSLDASGADETGSPLEERALALRARLLVATGRMEAARATAERYLARFPQGGRREAMRRLTDDDDDRGDAAPTAPE
ncbi:MAG: FecR domain-containing protein [Deltaproteobacteria bacterium]|nr:FecR domain-containing protein [Deltaproteobacteria bacterium]